MNLTQLERALEMEAVLWERASEWIDTAQTWWRQGEIAKAFRCYAVALQIYPFPWFFD